MAPSVEHAIHVVNQSMPNALPFRRDPFLAVAWTG
jgi:hypothetical protein